jgi:hypothetical protein
MPGLFRRSAARHARRAVRPRRASIDLPAGRRSMARQPGAFSVAMLDWLAECDEVAA